VPAVGIANGKNYLLDELVEDPPLGNDALVIGTAFVVAGGVLGLWGIYRALRGGRSHALEVVSVGFIGLGSTLTLWAVMFSYGPSFLVWLGALVLIGLFVASAVRQRSPDGLQTDESSDSEQDRKPPVEAVAGDEAPRALVVMVVSDAVKAFDQARLPWRRTVRARSLASGSRPPPATGSIA